MFQKGIPKFTLCCLLFIHIQASGYTGCNTYIKDDSENVLQRIYKINISPEEEETAEQSQDQTSSRTNTLFDDADDIQRQLDNEARDRIKFGRPKTIWVFHFPTHFPDHNTAGESIGASIQEQLDKCSRQFLFQRLRKRKAEEEEDAMTPPCAPTEPDWDYGNQAKWAKSFPDCAGKSQSPVDLPISGLIKARGARTLLFQNYNVEPKTMTLMNDGKRVMLFGEWKSEQRPLIYGGAAHSRRYLFHSLTLHLPSEHTVGGLQYPLESQGLYVSAEYKDMEQALDASPSDPQAFLAVANLYKYSNRTHKGTQELLTAAKNMGMRNATVPGKPLMFFNPPFKEYACYQGSMTTPPCTESVLWLIRGRTLSIMREAVEAAQSLLATEAEPRHLYFRAAQALNDRKVYLFK